MGFTEILFMSIGLGMDAFAVAICKGLSMTKMKWKSAIIIALYFGIFQALMPLLGFVLGKRFSNAIIKIDNYIGFFLIAAIGINMLIETIRELNLPAEGLIILVRRADGTTAVPKGGTVLCQGDTLVVSEGEHMRPA